MEFNAMRASLSTEEIAKKFHLDSLEIKHLTNGTEPNTYIAKGIGFKSGSMFDVTLSVDSEGVGLIDTVKI